MQDFDTNTIIHDIVFGKFLFRLLTQYGNEQLTDAQLYTLYQECDTFENIADIIGYGTAEELP